MKNLLTSVFNADLLFQNNFWIRFVTVSICFLMIVRIFLILDKQLEKMLSKPILLFNYGFRQVLFKILKSLDTIFYSSVSLLICYYWFDLSFFSGIVFNSVIAVICYYLLISIQNLLIFSFAFYFEKKSGQKSIDEIEMVRSLGVIPLIIRILTSVLVIIYYFNILNFDIGNLVATLGVSSLIIAFALQSVLQDLFASLSVYLDKPFEVGDYIKTSVEEGTVIKVGIRSTRIKSRTGEMLIIPNKILSEGKIKNFKGIEVRKVFDKVSLKSNSNSESIALFIADLKEYISKIDKIILERISIHDISKGCIEVEIVYEHNTSEFDEYSKARTDLNLEVIEKLEKYQLELYEGQFVANINTSV